MEDDGRVLPWAAGDHERRFGQAIAGEEGFPAEPAGGKGADELLDGLGADPLRAQEGQIPLAQIQLCPLLGGDLPRAEVVGEVGAAADVGPRTRDRLQPQGRPLQERGRRHQGRRPAAVDRLNHAADESHVMVQRQPEDGVAFCRRLKRLLNQRRVVEQMVVTEHHSFRQGCRSGRVLQEGDLPPLDLQVVPGLLALGPEPIDRDPRPLRESRLRGVRPPGLFVVFGRAEDERRPRCSQYRLDRRGQAIAVGNRRRNGNNSRIQASEESGDEIQPRREQQECSLAEGSQGLQLTRDRHRALVQGLVSQARFLLAVAAQEAEGLFFAHRGGPLTQQVNQAANLGYARRRGVYLSLHYGSLGRAEIRL